MAETTKIEWADSTLNIWEGCQETGSPACVGCYAKARNLRYAPKGTTEAPNWGPHAPRREVKSWRATLRKISRMAKAANRPWFVFVNSLSDFWDNQANRKLREAALDEFRRHPHLTFLLLTKRPQNILKMAKKMVDAGLGPYATDEGIRYWWPRNVAIGCTVVTQAEADRDIPWLLQAKTALRPAFAFVSMEPLAEIVDLRMIRAPGWAMTQHMDALTGKGNPSLGDRSPLGQRIDWVITGGGTDQGKHKAYPTPPDAFRRARDDCAAANVAYLHKQNGEWVSVSEVEGPQTAFHKFDDGATVRRVGKRRAGRTLDGVEHNARPAVAA